MRTKILGILLMLLGASCTFSEHKQGVIIGAGGGTEANNSLGNDNGQICASDIDFDLVKKTILEPKCLACHGAGSGLIALDSYSAVTANINRVQSAIQSGRMPPNRPLTDVEKNLLSSWVDTGMLDTKPAVVADCNATEGEEDTAVDVVDVVDELVPVPQLMPNYESIKSFILEPKCIGCHGAFSGLDFSTYGALLKNNNLFIVEDGKDSVFVKVLASGFMPPQPTKLNPDEITVIRMWVQLGLPEK